MITRNTTSFLKSQAESRFPDWQRCPSGLRIITDTVSLSSGRGVEEMRSWSSKRDTSGNWIIDSMISIMGTISCYFRTHTVAYKKNYQLCKVVLWRLDSKSISAKPKWRKWIQMWLHPYPGHAIKEVNDFVYLGCTVCRDGSIDMDIRKRINKTQQAFFRLTKIWRKTRILNAYKFRLFNACVKSVLLYNCKTWKVTKDITKKFQTFVNKCDEILRKF